MPKLHGHRNYGNFHSKKWQSYFGHGIKKVKKGYKGNHTSSNFPCACNALAL